MAMNVDHNEYDTGEYCYNCQCRGIYSIFKLYWQNEIIR